MKISILMATYETPSDLLISAIDSVAEQTHEDWELVIKDGSEKNPAIDDGRVRDRFNWYGSRINYAVSYDSPPAAQCGVSTHNGCYAAINDCVRRSTGEVLSIMQADDERGNSTVLEHVNKIFEAVLPVKPFLVYGKCDWIGRNGEFLETKTPINIPVTWQKMLRDYPLYTPAFFWNRSVHVKFGLFDYANYKWCADLDFWLRCLKGGMETAYVCGVLGKYRVWETSLSKDNGHIMGPESLAIQKKHGL